MLYRINVGTYVGRLNEVNIKPSCPQYETFYNGIWVYHPSDCDSNSLRLW